MRMLGAEPVIRVGLLSVDGPVRFRLEAESISPDSMRWPAGDYVASVDQGLLSIRSAAGRLLLSGQQAAFRPSDTEKGRFTIVDIVIGIGFHWERKQDQTFKGELELVARPPGDLIVVNRVPIEDYLTSVIASEMSASSPLELLRAHAIVSRSWLLAQLKPWKVDRKPSAQIAWDSDQHGTRSGQELIRWYSRTDHADFDVCADDHCQRYQGVTKSACSRPSECITSTRGLVLTLGEEICDARFSKCCGGMTEDYRAAWEDVEVPYLRSVIDTTNPPPEYRLPLTIAERAQNWIIGRPSAYCNTSDLEVLKQVLPDFDQETQDFFRWEVVYRQDEIREILDERVGLDFGRITGFAPIERGASGRLIRLKIIGDKSAAIIGKELEIRRALSRSHLYSSAFVVEPEAGSPVPSAFRLRGAGWGHGVGLCQIGAAVMASQGIPFHRILEHYYRGTSLFRLYS